MPEGLSEEAVLAHVGPSNRWSVACDRYGYDAAWLWQVVTPGFRRRERDTTAGSADAHTRCLFFRTQGGGRLPSHVPACSSRSDTPDPLRNVGLAPPKRVST